MTNEEHARKFLSDMFDPKPEQTVRALAAEFDEVRKEAVDEMEAKSDLRRQALDEILEWIGSEASSPPEPAAVICLEAKAEFEKRWSLR